MQGNLFAGLIEGVALAPSGAAAATVALRAQRRFRGGQGAGYVALISGATVSVATVTLVVYRWFQLGIFDTSAPQRIHVALGVVTGLFAACATLRRFLRGSTSAE